MSHSCSPGQSTMGERKLNMCIPHHRTKRKPRRTLPPLPLMRPTKQSPSAPVPPTCRHVAAAARYRPSLLTQFAPSVAAAYNRRGGT